MQQYGFPSDERRIDGCGVHVSDVLRVHVIRRYVFHQKKVMSDQLMDVMAMSVDFQGKNPLIQAVGLPYVGLLWRVHGQQYPDHLHNYDIYVEIKRFYLSKYKMIILGGVFDF